MAKLQLNSYLACKSNASLSMPVTAKDSAVLAANLIISLSQILLELATEVLSDPEFAKSIKIV